MVAKVTSDSLTVNYRQIASMPIGPRIQVAASLGDVLARDLTPGQRMSLFPSYYKDFVSSGGQQTGGNVPNSGGTALTNAQQSVSNVQGGGNATASGSTGTAPVVDTRPKTFKPTQNQKQQAILDFAKRWNISPEAAAGVLNIESGISTNIRGGAGGNYYGVFQLQGSQVPVWTEKAGLGRLNPDQFQNLSLEDQLKVMDEYYKGAGITPNFFTGDPKKDTAKMWALQLAPGNAKDIDYDNPNSIISRTQQAGVISGGAGLVTVQSVLGSLPGGQQFFADIATAEPLVEGQDQTDQLKTSTVLDENNYVNSSAFVDEGGSVRSLPIPAAVKEKMIYAQERAGIAKVVSVSSGQMPWEEAEAMGATVNANKDWVLPNGQVVGHGAKHRHSTDVGAGDLQFYDEAGNLLSVTDPKVVEYMKYASAAGLKGIGAGEDYMGNYTVHVGAGTEASWGGLDRMINPQIIAGDKMGDSDFLAWKKQKLEMAQAAGDQTAQPLAQSTQVTLNEEELVKLAKEKILGAGLLSDDKLKSMIDTKLTELMPNYNATVKDGVYTVPTDQIPIIEQELQKTIPGVTWSQVTKPVETAAEEVKPAEPTPVAAAQAEQATPPKPGATANATTLSMMTGTTLAAEHGAEVTKPYMARPVDGDGPNIYFGEHPETIIPSNRLAENVGPQPYQDIMNLAMMNQMLPMETKGDNQEPPNRAIAASNGGVTSSPSVQSQASIVVDHPIMSPTMRKHMADSKLESRWNELSPIGGAYTNYGSYSIA